MPDYIYDENSFQWLFEGEPEEDPDMLALLAPFLAMGIKAVNIDENGGLVPTPKSLTYKHFDTLEEGLKYINDTYGPDAAVEIVPDTAQGGFRLGTRKPDKPDATNYRPERYTDPQTGQTYERTSPGGDWKQVDAPVQQMQPQARPDPILSFDDMIAKAVMRGDYRAATAIDAFRDSLGVDRLAVVNQVMAFYLSQDVSADTIASYRTNPPPLLAMALEAYAQALNPTGGVDFNAIMAQNVQYQQPLAEAIMEGMRLNPSWQPLNPYTGAPMFDPNAPFPGVPGGVSNPADAQGNVTPESARVANYAEGVYRPWEEGSTEPAYGERFPDDESALPPVGRTDPSVLRANAYTDTADRSSEWKGTGRGGINPAAVARYAAEEQNVDPYSGEDTDRPLIGRPRTQYGYDIEDDYQRADETKRDPIYQPTPENYGGVDIDEATGEPRNAPPPAMANAKARYEYFLQGDVEKGVAAQEPYRAAQSSGYYAGDLEEQGEAARAASGNYVYDKDYRQPSGSMGGYVSQAYMANKQKKAQPYGDYSDILGSYEQAARKREEARRKPRRSVIYSA